MKLISPTDSMFLIGESREHPMHVAGLALFEPPEGSGPDFVGDMHQAMVANEDFQPTFRKHPGRLLGGISNVAWAFDDEVDIDYHLRRSALPRPGRIRELLELTSRLHGTLLDRHRPLWEAHLVEGLEDGRFAVYTKIHHAAVDGGAGMALTNMMYDLTPAGRQVTPPPPAAKHELPDALELIGGAYKNMLSQQVSALQKIPDVLKAIASVTMPVVGNVVRIPTQGLPNLIAPKTILNATITSQRSFTARSLPLAAAKAIAKETGAKLNDVVMATCAGALRRYLIEKHALPKESLVAFVPVSLRDPGNTEANNQVSGMLCSLATDIKDPVERLHAIQESSRQAKDLSGRVRDAQPRDFSIFGAPFMMHEAMQLYGRSRLADRLPPPANVVISNVPGPQVPLYVAGAKVLTLYPVSIPSHGMALNLTVQSYCGSLDFGLTACRKTVPDLRKLAGYIDESLQELYDAVFPAKAREAKTPAHTPAARKGAPAGARVRTAGKSDAGKDAPRTARAAKARTARDASAAPASATAKRSPVSRPAKTTGKTARA